MKPSRLPVLAWILALGALFAYVLWLGPTLPPRMASHFGMGGHANAWDARSRYLALYLGVVSAVELLLVGFGFALPRLSRDSIHVPRSDYWRSDEHYPEACAMVRDFLFWLGALMALWFACLHGLIVQANRASPPHLNGGALAALVVLYGGVLALLIVRPNRRFRRAADGAPA